MTSWLILINSLRAQHRSAEDSKWPQSVKIYLDLSTSSAMLWLWEGATALDWQHSLPGRAVGSPPAAYSRRIRQFILALLDAEGAVIL
jgi:hypothetical protein